jgi:AraC-like DNA-binding protein
MQPFLYLSVSGGSEIEEHAVFSEGAGRKGMRMPGHTEPSAGRSLPVDIQRVLSYIEENAFDPELNVQKIKSECGLRDNNVSTRFHLFTGVTIRSYLESRRMDAAALLLQQSRATVMEVAFAVGYNNLPTFYGAFHRRYACPPDAYRRKISQAAPKDSGAVFRGSLD